jgi:hypothetical protein
MPHKDPEAKKAYMREWAIKNREHKRQAGTEWYRKNRDMVQAKRTLRIMTNPEAETERIHRKYLRYKERMDTRRKDTRQEAIAAYGGKCVCCGESNPAFLTFDHKNNDGHLDRVSHIAAKLKREGWPDQVRLMCYNCNCSRAFINRGGDCPHKNSDHIRGILLLQPEAFA